MPGAEPSRARAHEIPLVFQLRWAQRVDDAGRGGLLTADERVRALLGTALSRPEARYVVPDLISLDASADPGPAASIARLMERQEWLVKSVLPLRMDGSA